MILADEPKSLSIAAERETRLAAIRQPNVAPLSDFVERLRSSIGDAYQVPYFDPFDGGVAAECLFLLEVPGPKAIQSGFVSRNNPDETAKNFLLLNRRAGIDRSRTVVWNIVPWYVGTGTKIRPVNTSDIEKSLPSLREVLGLLDHLRVVVLVGRKAAAAHTLVASWCRPHGSSRSRTLARCL